MTEYAKDWHLSKAAADMTGSELIAAVFGLHADNDDGRYLERIYELQRERRRRGR